jgi:hypothetical protein
MHSLILILISLLPPEDTTFAMTEEKAMVFVRLAIKGISKEFPNKPADVLNGDDDVMGPRQVHPAFYGCYDWHSAVHGHWMLVRILKRFPDLPLQAEIRSALAANLTKKNLEIEALYFSRPNAKSYERPYGWSWLLKLAEELHTWNDSQGNEWSANLKPLTDAIVKQYLDYFPKQTYPIRSGVHSSTAFGLSFALDYARTVGNSELEDLIIERSRYYFAKDENIPASWEPDGADFFSPSLIEADLMRRVMTQDEFRSWLSKYLPHIDQGDPPNLLQPATVSDRTDPQLVHLDGLNISRAWCMRNIAAIYPESSSIHKTLITAARCHAQAAIPYISSGDYAGEHWLASFATYLLTSEK